MRRTACLFLLFVLHPAWSVSQPYSGLPKTKIVPQPDAPLQITRFFSRCGRSYTSRCGSGYSASSRADDEGGIYHSVEYKNVSDRSLAAVRLGLLTFDQWQDLLDGIDGIAVMPLAPGATRMTTWADPVSGTLVSPTAIAYVGKVRFSDGEVWSADLDRILEELEASGWAVPSLSFSLCEPEPVLPSVSGDEPRREPPMGEPPGEPTTDDGFLDVEPVLEPSEEDEPPL